MGAGGCKRRGGKPAVYARRRQFILAGAGRRETVSVAKAAARRSGAWPMAACAEAALAETARREGGIGGAGGRGRAVARAGRGRSRRWLRDEPAGDKASAGSVEGLGVVSRLRWLESEASAEVKPDGRALIEVRRRRPGLKASAS